MRKLWFFLPLILFVPDMVKWVVRLRKSTGKLCLRNGEMGMKSGQYVVDFMKVEEELV
jgi:hypothetical protein